MSNKPPDTKAVSLQLNPFRKLVHVAVLCPPGAAVTALLNKMGTHGGMFVMMMQIPFQVGALAKSNGQENIQLFPMMIFAIVKEEFESWLSCQYDEVGAYQMEDIMNDKVVVRR